MLTLSLATSFESYSSLYDAEYVGSETCGECHTVRYATWEQSPHANMARPAGATSIVGDFEDGSWTLPPEAQFTADDEKPAARMYREGDDYYMALQDPVTREYVPLKIEYAIGYQYRQTYLVREQGGVLRRLPLQWSVEQQAYFPYWNYQEGSMPSVEDLWAQMEVPNSAWNLFCARCHTTNLVIYEKDLAHTVAVTDWIDDGIACESCHGPGSQHANYFENNYVNRVVAFANSNLRGEPVAYIVNPNKLEDGEAMSTCARCHGADIHLGSQDIYRIYEPGYSREGRINDLSAYFQEVPLTPGRTIPTVEVYDDGRPKGIGMLFRSFVDDPHYEEVGIRCYDCHNPHNNGESVVDGLLDANDVSDRYCLDCHGELAGNEEAHTFHEEGTAGSFCYECHMPHNISNIVTGVQKWTRTHAMGSIPNPAATIQYGYEGSPNACNECHTDQTPAWALDAMLEWYGANTPGAPAQPDVPPPPATSDS